jgi:hypothetical protein
MAHTVLRTTGNAIVFSMLLAVGSSRLAWAATIDCETINAASAASVPGVPKAKSNPSEGHHEQPPDNMDVFACGYVEIGTGSTGWVRLSANGETYDGSIVFRRATNIVVLKVAGMPNADAAKTALVKAGSILAQS